MVRLGSIQVGTQESLSQSKNRTAPTNTSLTMAQERTPRDKYETVDIQSSLG